jgi:iron complex transport system substrate-binding protein
LLSLGGAACQPAQPADDSSAGYASTSLCGDSYLLALKPQNVSALSWQSDSDLSRATAAQKALPQISDRAEDIVQRPNSIIVFGPGEGAKTAKYAKQSVSLAWGETFETVWENMERLALGSSAGWKTRLETLDKPASKPKILYLSRAGGTAGINTFVDAVITAAGGENVIITQGWFTPDPETLLAQKPDIILTSFYDSDYASVNDSGYRHKAVRDFVSAYPRIDIPGALWPCAGPGLVEAAEQLNAALQNVDA